jgi:hypothetical protein
VHKIELLEPVKRVFGGNFFCDCGGGFLDNPCLCIPKKSKLFGICKRLDKEDLEKQKMEEETGEGVDVEMEERGGSEEREEVMGMEVEEEEGEKEVRRIKKLVRITKGKKKTKQVTPEKC